MDRNFLQFQQNLRRTALGVRFGRTLLTEPTSITPKQITNVLRALGADVPKELEVVPEAAQALTLGTAVVRQYQAGASIGSLVRPGVSAIQTLNIIGERYGLIDNRTSTQIAVAGDVALLFASGGTNVASWVRLAMAVGQESARSDAEALGQAQFRAAERASYFQRVEADKFLDSIKDLQAGKLGIFSFMVENAVACPLLYSNAITRNPAFSGLIEKFPGLNFLPKQIYNFEGEGGSVTFWGEQKTKRFTVSVEGLKQMTQDEAITTLLHAMAGPGLNLYLKARGFYLNQFKADLFNAAVLALFEPSFYLSPTTDVYSKLIQYQLTPYDLGERDTFDNAIVTTNNRAIISNFGLVSQEKPTPVERMKELDEAGDLSSLLKSKEAREIVQRRFSFSEVPFEKEFQGYRWRDLSNFVSLLDFLDLVMLDPMYAKYREQSQSLNEIDLFPKLQQFKESYQTCFEKSVLRRINQASKYNASYFLNTPVKKLSYKISDGGPTIFK